MTADYDGQPMLPLGGRGCLWELLFLLLLLLALFVTSSCKSGCTITEDTMAHDTCFIAYRQTDSIYLHDSIFQDRWREGDTVYQYKYVEKYKYRDIVKHDSIYIAKTDTVVKTKTITQKKTFVQRLKDSLLDWVLILLLCIAVLYIILEKLNVNPVSLFKRLVNKDV